jgi:hypothetical protein
MYSKKAQLGKNKPTRAQVNKKANRELEKLRIKKDIRHCELCPTLAISNAHRHPRVWYRNQDKLLWDFKQVIFICIECHTKMDNRSKTSEAGKEAIFNRLRA